MKTIGLNIGWILLFLGTQVLFGQAVEPSSGVEKRTIQFELESLYMIEKEETEQMNTWSMPNLLVRYGLNETLEIQLNVPLIRERMFVEGYQMNSRVLLDNIQAGISLDLWSSKGWRPEAALMARALIPVYDFDSGDIGKLLSLNFSNQFSRGLSLNYNFGLIATKTFDQGYYIANLSWEINPVTHCFAEFIGTLEPGEMYYQCFNCGLGFNLSDSFCLDLSVAFGLNHGMNSYGGILTYLLPL